MGRKLETAHISFGLVTIPVGIYPAIDEQDIHFNQLHARCGSRIKQQRICPVCNCEVPYDELVKGYEIAKDQYVRIDPSELDQLRAAESEAIDILEFVPLSAVKGFLIGSECALPLPLIFQHDPEVEMGECRIRAILYRPTVTCVRLLQFSDIVM